MSYSSASSEGYSLPPLYTPLQTSYIRLIAFRVSKNNKNIELNLIENHWAEDLDYHALSYVWGNGLQNSTIWINGHSFQISKHLYNFLEMARDNEAKLKSHTYPEKSSTGRTRHPCKADRPQGQMRWWIDAICIDQTNIEERNEQVPRMGKIYSTASQVWSWLGRSSDLFNTDGRFEELKQTLAILPIDWEEKSILPYLASIERASLYNNTPNDGLSKNQCEAMARAEDKDGENKLSNGRLDARPSWQFLLNLLQQNKVLLSHSYFTRAWVIQEYLLNRRLPTALVDSFSFTLENLILPAWWLLKDGDKLDERLHAQLLDTTLAAQNFATLKRASDRHLAVLERSPVSAALDSSYILYFLRAFYLTESTVPHDQFYSLLGLIDSDKLPAALKPDYRLSFEQVSLSYTSYVIEATNDLRILETHNSLLEDCPTWVPDLRFRFMPLGWKDSAPLTTGAVSTSCEGRVLNVEGTLMGRLLYCTCFGYTFDVLENKLRYLRDKILPAAACIKGETEQVIFTKCMHSYYQVTGKYAETLFEMATSIDSLLETFSTLIRHIPESALEHLPLTIGEIPLLLAKCACPNPDLLFSLIVLAQLDFYLLDTGDIVACGRKANIIEHTPEDCVWALKGGAYFTLLRPNKDNWEHLGIVLWKTEDDVSAEAKNVPLNEEFFAAREVRKITLI